MGDIFGSPILTNLLLIFILLGAFLIFDTLHDLKWYVTDIRAEVMAIETNTYYRRWWGLIWRNYYYYY